MPTGISEIVAVAAFDFHPDTFPIPDDPCCRCGGDVDLCAAVGLPDDERHLHPVDDDDRVTLTEDDVTWVTMCLRCWTALPKVELAQPLEFKADD